MTPEPWLPHNALEDRVLPDAVEQEALAWAEQWIVHPPPVNVSSQAMPHIEALWWQAGTNDAFLGVGAEGRALLATAMLGGVPWKRRRAADAKLAERLVQYAVPSFLERICRRFGLPDAPVVISSNSPPRNSLCFQLALDGSVQLGVLAVSRLVAISARKRLSPPSRRLGSLHSRTSAISGQRVRVGAYLGAARVKLAEVNSLADGDILVLDKSLQSAFSLTLNDRPSEQNCTLDQHGEALALRFAPDAKVNDL